MDRVRLGRALGYGTRHAAKTVAAVVEAAAAPSNAPSAPMPPHPEVQRPASRPSVSPATRVASAGRGAQQLKRSFWQPLATFSGALWLRVTGLFFCLLALTMGGGAWRLRDTLHTPAGPFAAHRFWLFALFTALFGYFTLSSFIRASLKERRAAAR